MVWGERQPVGQPNPPLLRSGPVLNQDLLADPNLLSTPLQTAAPWPLLRLERLPPARLTARTAKAFQKAWEALEAGLGLFGHRFMGPGTQKGRAGQALSGQILCPEELSCGQRKNVETPLEFRAQGGALLPRS